MKGIIKTSEAYFNKFFNRVFNLKLDLSYTQYCNLDKIRSLIKNNNNYEAKKIYNKEFKNFILTYNQLEKSIYNFYKKS